MPLPLQTFPALVRLQAQAATASARELLDTSTGSVLRALLEANASVALWVQYLATLVLAATRAGTSRGADLDTWMADFGAARLPGVAAVGVLALGRDTPGWAARVPPGTLVRADGVLVQVVADAGHPAWDNDAYVLAPDVLTLDVPAAAVAVGRAGNIRAGTARLLASAVAGVDRVDNPYPFEGGLDVEDDDALRARFTLFLDSRSRGTADALRHAVAGVRQGLQVRVAEGVDTAGLPRPGAVTLVLDDGSGAPTQGLLADVAAAVELVRPVGVAVSVAAPVPVGALVRLRVVGSAQARAAAEAAVGVHVAGLGIGEALVRSRLVAAAHGADAGVVAVEDVAVNAVAADLAVPPNGRVRLLGVEVLA